MEDRLFWRRESDRFLLSLQFFTRIPIPAQVPYSEDELNRAVIYFPLIGTLIGGISGAVFLTANLLWDTSVALFLSMVASLLLTGAFHEDGLADFADGMGGGWTRERILTIMQDSRLGTFGAAALFAALAGKFLFLLSLPVALIAPLMALGHTLSRIAATSMMLNESYARAEGKAKPLAVRISPSGFVLAVVLGLVPFLFLSLPALLWLAVLPLIPLRLWFAHWLRKWLGGFTGDCLGALQQLSELVFLLAALALCRLI